MPRRLRELLTIGLGVLAGIVVSSLFEQLLDPNISFPSGWPDFFLLALFGTLGVMIWFVVGMRSDLDKTRANIERVIEKKIDQIGTSVEYVEEEWTEENPRTGKLFDFELGYVSRAERELLILANVSVALTLSQADLSRREVLLKAIEENIVKHKDSGFRYVRISQFPEGLAHPVFIPLTKDHFTRIFQIKRAHPTLDLELMVVNTNRDFSFIIVDGQTLIIEVAGVKMLPAGEQKYAIGYFTITDRSGQLITSFERYFRKMERQARPLTLEDLTPQ